MDPITMSIIISGSSGFLVDESPLPSPLRGEAPAWEAGKKVLNQGFSCLCRFALSNFMYSGAGLLPEWMYGKRRRSKMAVSSII
jgi:hypothetical protein